MEQHPGATVGDIAKQLGAAWKIMTKEQKKPYEQRAEKDRARYLQQMSTYRDQNPSEPAEVEDDDDEEDYSDDD